MVRQEAGEQAAVLRKAAAAGHWSDEHPRAMRFQQADHVVERFVPIDGAADEKVGRTVPYTQGAGAVTVSLNSGTGVIVQTSVLVDRK